ILNNHHVSDIASWGAWWSSTTIVVPPEFSPIAVAKAASERFPNQTSITTLSLSPKPTIASRTYVTTPPRNKSTTSSMSLPPLRSPRSTICVACPFANGAKNLALQEKLSHYLDVVDLHLVKEISLLSSSFFET
ncbi:hypothetical protein VIGAN_07119700, partial [Vigna angularis var. angularis]